METLNGKHRKVLTETDAFSALYQGIGCLKITATLTRWG